jgi:hypothetical protein
VVGTSQTYEKKNGKIKYRNNEELTISWSRDLPEKLTDPQLLRKLPALYATQRFKTLFTKVHHLSMP